MNCFRHGRYGRNGQDKDRWKYDDEQYERIKTTKQRFEQVGLKVPVIRPNQSSVDCFLMV